MTPKYQYPHLRDRGKTHFRLLKLFPAGRRDEPLQCELSEHKLESPDVPAYRAMSYVWGRPEDKRRINCRGDGRKVEIPTNLKRAFEYIRDPSNPQYLWADSICFDQNDKAEKADQISVMGQIYRGAEKVYVWLGKDNEQDAFNMMTTLRTKTEHEDDVFKAAVDSCPSRQWESLSKVLRLPWFERVWTLQEIGLASHGVVIWGDNRMDWAEFLAICRRLTTVCKKFRLDRGLWFHRVLRTDLDFRNGPEGPGLVLKRIRSRQCSNNVDRIHGVMGHRAFEEFKKKHGPFNKDIDPVDDEKVEESQQLLRIDRTVSQQLFRLSEPLYVLSLIQQDKDTMSDTPRPSWVPRFKQKTFISTLADESKRDGSWAAGGDHNVGNLVPKEEVLKLKGVVVDSVKWRSGKITNSLKDGDKHGLVKDIWKHMRKRRETRRLPSEKEDMQKLCDIFYFEDHFVKREQSSAETRPGTNARLAQCLAYFEKNKISLAENGGRWGLPTGNAEEFFPDALHHCRNRRFIVTEKGYLGLAPEVAEEGDSVCVFLGGQVPFLLRPIGHGKYRVCGECFVHGMMEGEAMKLMSKDKLKKQDFKLV